MKKIFKAKSVKGHLVFEDQQALNLLVWSLNEKEVNVTKMVFEIKVIVVVRFLLVDHQL